MMEMIGNATSVPQGSCPHCGMWHGITCPRIRAIEYHPNGAVKRVEYWEYKVRLGDGTNVA